MGFYRRGESSEATGRERAEDRNTDPWPPPGELVPTFGGENEHHGLLGRHDVCGAACHRDQGGLAEPGTGRELDGVLTRPRQRAANHQVEPSQRIACSGHGFAWLQRLRERRSDDATSRREVQLGEQRQTSERRDSLYARVVVEILDPYENDCCVVLATEAVRALDQPPRIVANTHRRTDAELVYSLVDPVAGEQQRVAGCECDDERIDLDAARLPSERLSTFFSAWRRAYSFDIIPARSSSFATV